MGDLLRVVSIDLIMKDRCSVDYRRYKRGQHKLGYSRCYNTWHSMKARCTNTNSTSYEDYGGRGISYDPRWEDFDVFFEDMGHPPDGYTLERKDNDGDYTPQNCVWATQKTQSRNRRTNVMLTHQGKTMCITDWAEHLGIRESTIRYRLDRGLSLDVVLSPNRIKIRPRTPINPMRNIYARKDRGTFQVSVTVDGLTTKRSFRTLSEAQQFRDMLFRKHDLA